MASLKARVEEIVRGDAAKNALLEEMLADIEQLTQQRDAARNELDMARDTARTYYQKMVQAESEKSLIKTSMEECDRFVLVLVDGDSMPFLDEFVSRGLEGGEEAGKHLRAAILEYYKTNTRYHADDRVIIRVYANCHGLSRTYKTAKIIPDEIVFDQFMVGFNRSHPLSDYIDAGNHKEAADSKMKANLELFYRNYHCQHIVFGGSADSSYAGFLGPYALPNALNDRITLLEGPPFPYDLKKVAQGFQQTSFKAIFRSTKIQIIPNGTATVVAGVKRPAPEPLSAVRDRPSPRPVAAVLTPPKAQPGLNAQQPAVSPIVPSPIIYQNQYGQRLDIPLKIDKQYLQYLYDYNSRLCNNFYLKGQCTYGANCEWDHSQVLNQVQLDTFRHKARTSACRSAFCQDPQCPLGHMCPRNGACNIPACKFLPEMHHIDMSQVYECNTATKERKKVSVPA
ncbi:uncharacterized protein Z520_02934 [Fonsecaea multimorphosa CBS 102226]|uniref:C3H1-type domain-containing protein n=1 Tax=Fonsecaea multimorphosa CBS 102226 TaxID=1442371 RepID=A0A0D2IWM0_9EURO|nr:uncharacterized protein Z520_02934 [Fonsecaea multimorphosa CBS 102226]KIY01382.1 hypothetical protein Z520_02934 [Fonsecaea multimorphosa CBS 102226]OAL28398.1 hypothetical protein AYO22_02852 [Fonsecaea multimorphosa]